MKRLEYQEETIERLKSYLETLVVRRDAAGTSAAPDMDWCGQAWGDLQAAGGLPNARDAHGDLFFPPWLHRLDGFGRPVPNVCLKLPTGAGKTYLATRGIEQIQRLFLRRAYGLVLWIVPSDAIYSQTWRTLADREHPHRMTLERASGGRVKLLHRGDSFTKADVEHSLCVLVLMMAAAARQETEVLRMFQDSGRYAGFFPAEDDFAAQRALLSRVPNLETLDVGDDAWGGGPSVKESLGNVLCLTRPIVVLDEGHTAYTPTRRSTLARFNPSFILELSATPNRAKEQQSNVLHSVSGVALKREGMVKLPLNLHTTENGDWQDTLAAAHGLLDKLQVLAELKRHETGRYLRPILLIRVERTGKNQLESGKVHADHVRRFLHDALGAKAGEVAEKSSSADELSALDLMSERCPVRFIITKDALREGWDCPFAYVLAVLDETTAGTALTQMVGRILRQPHAERFGAGQQALNESYVFVRRQDVADAVAGVREGLANEGLGDLGELVRAAGTVPTSVGSTGIETERGAPDQEQQKSRSRILTRAGAGWRGFDFESDLSPLVPWEALEWARAVEFAPTDVTALAQPRVAVDVDPFAPNPPPSPDLNETSLPAELDFPAVVRMLTDVVANPWQAARIWRRALATLRERGFTEPQLAASRYRLAEALRADLLAQIRRHMERIFCGLLATGDLSLELPDDGRNSDLAEKPDGLALFEQVWRSRSTGV